MPNSPAVTIKVFAVEGDTQSPEYQKLLRRAQAVANRFPKGQVEVVEYGSASAEAERYGLVLTPTTVVNDTIVSVGKLIPAGRLFRLVQAEIDEQTP